MDPYSVINGVVAKFQLAVGLLSPRLRNLMTVSLVQECINGLIYIAAGVTTILGLGL